jgi:hypothetical protein
MVDLEDNLEALNIEARLLLDFLPVSVAETQPLTSKILSLIFLLILAASSKLCLSAAYAVPIQMMARSRSGESVR